MHPLFAFSLAWNVQVLSIKHFLVKNIRVSTDFLLGIVCKDQNSEEKSLKIGSFFIICF